MLVDRSRNILGTRTPGITFWFVLREISIIVLLAISGGSLALSASSPPLKHPPLDPCLHFSEGSSSIRANDGSSTNAAHVGCPMFHPSFYDGRVCVRCCRDDYEIGTWGQLSSLEKGFALEDAADRARQRAIETKPTAQSDHEFFAGDSIPAEELDRQAAEWMSFAKKETIESNDVSTAPKKSTNEAYGPDANDGREKKPSSISIASPVGISANAKMSRTSLPVVNSQPLREALLNKGSSGKGENRDDGPTQNNTKTVIEKNDRPLPPPPPTPCTRICRYNQNCYDGKVCIGCFRETHEIGRWSSMSPTEKQYSLEDAADRSREIAVATAADLNDAGVDPYASFLDEETDASEHFEGGISETELRRQAMLWGAWKG